jgi:FtsP/CotA-like multicopper oxidase with cupredoxin domain
MNMKSKLKRNALSAAVSLILLGGTGMAQAEVNVQCPGDTNGDAVPETPMTGQNGGPVKCMHLTAGDSFAEMSDGHPMYTFGFANRTGVAPGDVISEGILAARWAGSKIELDEGDEFYLSLTNVGTVMRPDLFDPHTVHFHGFPNAATVFDGVPEVSISINMGSTLTYYYNVVEPGTYLYHCHVEATEHMEMGMLANLYVHPKQDAIGCFDVVSGVEVPNGNCPAGTRKVPGSGGPRGYAYNDNDGTTAFDVEAPIQVSGFDSHFHDAHIQVQPLPFASLRTNYPQINGRGYPDTVLDNVNDFPEGIVTSNSGAYQDYVQNTLQMHAPQNEDGTPWLDSGVPLNNGEVTQDLGAGITVASGQKLLLRFSNVSIDRFFTMTAPGLKMRVVGTGAELMRSADGTKNIYVDTASVNFGGGEAQDVIIDTNGVAPGTYFLTASELNMMSNATQLDGGLITEIVVTPGA